MKYCSECGQPLPPYRLGVRLTPLKAAIFDAVKRRGESGDRIHAKELLHLLREKSSVQGIKSHVWQINELLEDTAWRIDGHGGYRLVKRRTKS